jgi:hypothetical protein
LKQLNMTITVKNGQRIYVEKETKITKEEFEALREEVSTFLGGPANQEFEIGHDHWSVLSPVFFTPIDLERENHHEMWDQLLLLRNWLQEHGYICYGGIIWKEPIEKDEFFLEYFSARIAKDDGALTIWKRQTKWAIYEN